MRRLLFLACCALVLHQAGPAQQADLAGLTICIDPGHGGHSDANDRHVIPDPGIDFYESESNFEKALLLKGLLEAKGAFVLLTRNTNDYPDDALEPSLSARVQLANDNNADWFHSIHSNATGGVNTSTNYTLMLLREKRPGGIASGSGNGLGVPEYPEADVMARIMAPAIKAMNRTKSFMTYLDWTFYGGTSGGFSLGVLRGLAMPGELSEGSFHDNYPETRRLMNSHYRKMEAYALRNSFLQYYQAPADPLGIVAGIQTDIGTGLPVNWTCVRLLPGDRVCNGDGFNNGYYFFDSLEAGTYAVRFETPGRSVDSATVVVAPGSFTFVDRSLQTAGPPRIAATVPAAGDTTVMPSVLLQWTFSKPMDTASVRSGFSITPSVPGQLSWNAIRTMLTFRPDTSFAYLTAYTIRLEGTAAAGTGEQLDGNGDGTAGDAFQLVFRTRFFDVSPPKLIARYPAEGSETAGPHDVIALQFDERLDPASVTSSLVPVQKVAGGSVSLVSRTVQYWEANGRGGVNVYVQAGLEPGAEYRLRVSGFKDRNGNAISTSAIPVWSFRVAAGPMTVVGVVDSLRGSVSSWMAPGTSGSTTGIDSASFAPSPAPGAGSPLAPTAGCAALRYAFSAAVPPLSTLIREYLSGGPGRLVTWPRKDHVLEVYVNGDGSGTRFRFAVDDSVEAFPAGQGVNHEVSRWIPLDWIGWRLVQWDLDRDSLGAWIGNGTLEGQLRFDSFQLSARIPDGSGDTAAGPRQGQILFSNLQVSRRDGPAGVADPAREVPGHFALEQNYPNPFNPSTVIRVSIPAAGPVRLAVYDLLGREVAVLIDGIVEGGVHSVPFDGTALSSGIYLCRLAAGGNAAVRRMALIK